MLQQDRIKKEEITTTMIHLAVNSVPEQTRPDTKLFLYLICYSVVFEDTVGSGNSFLFKETIFFSSVWPDWLGSSSISDIRMEEFVSAEPDWEHRRRRRRRTTQLETETAEKIHAPPGSCSTWKTERSKCVRMDHEERWLEQLAIAIEKSSGGAGASAKEEVRWTHSSLSAAAAMDRAVAWASLLGNGSGRLIRNFCSSAAAMDGPLSDRPGPRMSIAAPLAPILEEKSLIYAVGNFLPPLFRMIH